MAVETRSVGLINPQHNHTVLAPVGTQERWRQLQLLRRGAWSPLPLLEQICRGTLAPDSDVLAALCWRLDRKGVEQLLASALADDPARLLEAVRPELAAMAAEPSVQQAWLEPLLSQQQRASGAASGLWLEWLGVFRDPRVAASLRAVIHHSSAPGGDFSPAVGPLLPLLGRQRDAVDAALLLQWALDPAPLALRRAALEGIALGLSAWPQTLLAEGLLRLAVDLDSHLGGTAIDLLARLPQGQSQLRRLRPDQLDPAVAQRWRRRLLHTPLVLVVHGRKGGEIPEPLLALAAALEQRRGAPVVLQALTAEPPPLEDRLSLAARRTGGITLVPLLLLPGEHVRCDLPVIAAAWRRVMPVRRLPFLGAWPAWQALLAAEFQAAAGASKLAWLHHPLRGPLSARYLQHLAERLGWPGLPAAYQPEPEAVRATLSAAAVLAPLTLAPNRLSESLNMDGSAADAQVLPPLLEWPSVREFLLSSLEALP